MVNRVLLVNIIVSVFQSNEIFFLMVKIITNKSLDRGNSDFTLLLLLLRRLW